MALPASWTRDSLVPLITGVIACAALLFPGHAEGALPDGWAYELVSPADTGGVDAVAGISTLASDGVHAWVGELLPLTESQATGNLSSLAATRTSTGWALDPLADPSTPGDLSTLLVAMSGDTTRVAVAGCQAYFLGCVAGVPYSIDILEKGGKRTRLVTISHDNANDPTPVVQAASKDLSTILFALDTSSTGLPPLLSGDTHTQGLGLYEIHNSTLEYAAVGEDDVALPCGAVLANNSGNVLSAAGTGFGQSGLSESGDTLAFESPDPDSGCPDPVDVYIRRSGHSVDISAPSDPRDDLGATYVGGSSDGDRQYFLSASQLSSDDHDSTRDVYEYDIVAGQRQRITSGSDVTSVAVSPSADYIYFLASGPIAGEGAPGAANLFVYHNGAAHLIATAQLGGVDPLGNAMATSPSPITPDGAQLLFSASELNGIDTGGQHQLMQYDAKSDRTRCISCPTDGSIAPAGAALRGGGQPASNVAFRFQSDDGSTVGFQTINALVPADVNGVGDVYVWKDGRLFLLGSGRVDASAGFLGLSADGGTVLFRSTERLVPAATQDNVKVYAARAGGGFPGVAPEPECLLDECQGLASAGPVIPVPGSEHFTGPSRAKSAPGRRRLEIVGLRRAHSSAHRRDALVVSLVGAGRKQALLRLLGRIEGRWEVLGEVHRALSPDGRTKVRILLSGGARRQLRSAGVLRLRLTAKYSNGELVLRRSLTLRHRS